MPNKKMEKYGSNASSIRELFEYSNRRKAEIGEENVFDFSLGNPSIPAPREVADEICRLVSSGDSTKLHGYTSATGALGTRKAISDSINSRFNCEANPENIYMTCGAAASLTITLRALCEEDKPCEVIVLAPFFPEYSVFIDAAGGKTVIVPCLEPDFSIDYESLCAAINKNTVAVIINYPNNPSGKVLNEEELKKLSSLLAEKSDEIGKPVYLISDEPYRELVYGDVPILFAPNYYKNTIVCYSYSKSLSLPGERIGYIFVPPFLHDAKSVYAAVCGAGRSSGYVCAPSLMQAVIEKCVDKTSDISLYDKNRRLLYESLKDIGYEAVEPKGAFYLFVKSLEDDENAFCEKAKKYELMLVPSESFGVKGYVRISYCVSYDTIKNSIPAFKKLFEEYRGE